MQWQRAEHERLRHDQEAGNHAEAEKPGEGANVSAENLLAAHTQRCSS
jgi:hypothetical protein